MISLFAGEERHRKLDKLGDPLVLLDKHIDFAAIASAVDARLKLSERGRGGRPPYPTVLMIKLLLLQQLYNLSDEALEFQALDRASFQRFLGLQSSSRIPDAKTVWVWRERLKQQDLIGDISAAVSGQLQRAGFIARGGQIIDASIVNAPIQRNTRQENAAIKQDQVPEDWSSAKREQKDVDARWTKKHGKAFYGYKLHANTDRRWGFIRQHAVTAASVHDSQCFESLLDPVNTSRALYADSGYADKAREAALKQQGYRVHIQRKGQANQPLSQAQQRRNHRIAKQRAFGEHPFARLAQQGGKGLRTIGLARATVVIGLKVASHNLMRLARLKHRGVVPA
ncbi:MAG TPA: IS5 family transposase [Xanthomonadales bacterium]|nr:IS5 family transposase [Xanthomonadales bacterium]